MNFELFIAKRIANQKNGEQEETKPAVRIAIGGIAIGLMVMILTVAISVGFKSEVRNKLIGFGSHIQVSVAQATDTDITPLTIDSALCAELTECEAVAHVQPTANQPGIIKTDDNFTGILLKGVGNDYNWQFFEKSLIEGRVPGICADSISKDILISKRMAEQLQLHLDEKIRTYYIIDGKVRVRPLNICGIYYTGFSDYDKMIAVADIKIVQKLNGWKDNQCGNIEIQANNYEELDAADEQSFSLTGNRLDETNGLPLMQKNIREINPQIFSWLDMLDMNVVIILTLMMLVAGFTIISGLLIIILGHTNMIGILKSLGAHNWSIRKIFIYQTLFLVGKGMIFGNIIAIAICFIQSHFHVITLDPEVYYVDAVPISISIASWLLINIGVFFVSALMLIAPTYIITHISPAESVKFE